MPTAGGHGLIDLGIVVPPDCPEGERCLTTIENQPRLHAGETVELFFYNDDDEVHEIFVTTEDEADPDRSNTSTEDAIAHAGPRTANRSASGGEFTVPEDAEALYVWCWLDDHEAEGERIVLQVDPPHAEDPDGAPGPGAVAVGVELLLAALWGARRRGPP